MMMMMMMHRQCVVGHPKSELQLQGLVSVEQLRQDVLSMTAVGLAPLHATGD
jgi:hypothetical protein